MNARLARPDFRGATFLPERDEKRLGAQLAAVRDFMVTWSGNTHFTLAQIARATGYPEASVSARLRDLRRLGYVVERRYIERGLHAYAVTSVPEAKP